LVYLGLVAVLISFWKLFDIDLATLLFEGNPRLLFYVSYVSLIIVPLPLIRYVESLLRHKKCNIIGATFAFYFLIVIILLLLQFFPFFDLRANISLILSLIAIVILSLIFTVVFEGNFNSLKKNNMKDLLPLFLVILSIGGILDIIIYFATKSTDDLVFTFIAFFVYSLIIALYSLSENDKRSYRDFQTGLYNSNSCKEFLDDNPYLPNCGVMMIDLNGLKYTNDHYGHAAGDRLILDLTEILKKSLPMNDFIGRYGGDEFIAVIKNCDQDKIERIKENLEYYQRECNEDRMPKLSFAYGYALSSEHDCKLEDLLKIADEKMYDRKEEYYKNH
jgi:diguanylate cyclase (GGDEF)-like protein